VFRSICSARCQLSFFTCSLKRSITPSPAAAKISASVAGSVGNAFESCLLNASCHLESVVLSGAPFSRMYDAPLCKHKHACYVHHQVKIRCEYTSKLTTLKQPELDLRKAVGREQQCSAPKGFHQHRYHLHNAHTTLREHPWQYRHC
jgi:hypothetical protein